MMFLQLVVLVALLSLMDKTDLVLLLTPSEDGWGLNATANTVTPTGGGTVFGGIIAGKPVRTRSWYFDQSRWCFRTKCGI